MDDPDAPLVARLRAGDASASNELVQRYEAQLRRVLERILKNKEDAAEVAQDAFVRSLTRLDSFQAKGPFRAWLFRIGVHLAIDRKNREGSHIMVDLEDDALFTSSLGTSRLVKADLWRRVEASIRALPPKQRMVVELRLYHEMPFQEIAVLAGTSVESAKMSFHHGVKRLRDVAVE